MQLSKARWFYLSVMACASVVWAACSDTPAKEPACEVAPGECPNACTEGVALEGEACTGPLDCACGFACVVPGVCAFYEGEEEGCMCEGVAMLPPPPEGLPVLGMGSHVTDDLLVEVLADRANQLRFPRDLAFNPDSPDQLWVINSPEETGPALLGGHMIVLHDATTDSPRTQYFWEGDGGSGHFFSHPSAFAFGGPSEMATIHETHEPTPLTMPGTPDEFMGPVLQDTNLEIFSAGWSSQAS